jgi:negative regulator of flagellin synthesis FlgM
VTTIHHGLDATGLAGLGSGTADKTQATGSQVADTSSQAPNPSIASNGDVQITSAAQLLSNVEQQIASAPDVNQSRVDAIRQSLANGSYQFNSSKVADGVLAAQQFDAQASAGPSSGTQTHSVRAFTTTAHLGAAKSG